MQPSRHRSIVRRTQDDSRGLASTLIAEAVAQPEEAVNIHMSAAQGGNRTSHAQATAESEAPVHGPSRWLLRPLRKGVRFALTGFLAAYLLLCIWDGFAWSTQLSPTYGLFLIRLVVVAVLALVDVVAFPFRQPELLFYLLSNAAIVFFPIGALHGLAASPSAERERPLFSGPSLAWDRLFLIGALAFMVMFGIDSEGAVAITYLRESPWSAAVLGLTTAVLVMRDLIASSATRGSRASA